MGAVVIIRFCQLSGMSGSNWHIKIVASYVLSIDIGVRVALEIDKHPSVIHIFKTRSSFFSLALCGVFSLTLNYIIYMCNYLWF